MNYSSENMKYLVTAMIWLGVLSLGVIMVVTNSIAGEGIGALMGGSMFIAAGIATGVIFKWGQIETSESAQQTDTGKAKNDQRGFDAASLLTDEDIAELREDVKASMRRRLLEHQDGELNSIDALLADQAQSKRR